MASTTAEMRTDSVSHTITAIAVTFAISTFVVISLRLFARVYVVRAVGTDDVLMCIACILSWAFIAATVLAVQHGMGDHIEVVMEKGQGNLVSYLQIVWFSSMFYNATLGFIKMSVLALYTRLGDKNLRRAAYVMMAVVGCQAGGNVLTCIFQCNPISAAWDITITEKKCVNINAFYLANAALNIATDLITYLLPLKLVIELKVSQKQRLALGVMLGLGLFACVSSIIRITFVPPLLTSTDFTFVISGAMYWSVIETNIGILAASIPSFKSIAKRYIPRVLGDSSANGQNPDTKGGPGGYRLSHAHRNFSKLDGKRSQNSYSGGSISLDALDADIVPRVSTERKDGVTTTVTAMDARQLADLQLERELRGYATHQNHGMAVSDQSHFMDDQVSNGSEEYIIPPGKGQIIRKTEVTRTVEGARHSGSATFFDDHPGPVVEKTKGPW